MNSIYIDKIVQVLGVKPWQIENCIDLIDKGDTIPFISRYRKERTGGLNEVEIADIKHLYNSFIELDKRKVAIIKSIEEQGKLTDMLRDEIQSLLDINELEDLYLPYKPKRKTKASIARERGLEPLAQLILNYDLSDNQGSQVLPFLNETVSTKEEALEGARNIISEMISENISVRQYVREQYLKYALLVSKQKGKDEEGSDIGKFDNYYDFKGNLGKMPSHRLLAILRGFREEQLSVKLEVDPEFYLRYIRSLYIKPGIKLTPLNREQLLLSIEDAYKRLLHPSLENTVINIAKSAADNESIKVFGENLASLLLAAPVGQKRVLAIDPGFRTGCKIVCLNAQGELLHNDTIYPHPPKSDKVLAMKKISNLIDSYKIEVIAIGDGTAGRETEDFLKKIALPEGVKVYSVSEDGASVYSASKTAREEFPDYDVTVRGAVSIGRRVMDPLAELVKIDPKSLGIGQYQHDVDQGKLKEKLDEVVERCVNRVGVNLNTASKHLLSYVSGIGESIANSIIEYRSANGAFSSRQELLNVSRLGNKAFEQCAGFLRIPDSSNPLDNSAVHPERYQLVEQIASDCGLSVSELIKNEERRGRIDIKRYRSESVGLPTLNDIMTELAKPGRDPRTVAKVFEFAPDIRSIDDLKVGMVIPGIVTNITNFGAFIDIGIKQDGLIHISQMSDKFISNPLEVIALQQYLKVRVIGIDTIKGRIQLSLKS